MDCTLALTSYFSVIMITEFMTALTPYQRKHNGFEIICARYNRFI